MEKIIILERFGFVDGVEKTQEQLAEKYNMSQANVSRLQSTALASLYIKLKNEVDIEDENFYQRGLY